MTGNTPNLDWLYLTVGLASGSAGVLVLLLALFLDQWNGGRRKSRCPGRPRRWCGYDMTGLVGTVDSGSAGAGVSPRCPECGRVAPGGGGLNRARRRWGWAALGFLLIGGGAATLVFNALDRHRWVRWAPSRMLIALLPSDPAAATAEWKGAVVNEVDRRVDRVALGPSARRALTLWFADRIAGGTWDPQTEASWALVSGREGASASSRLVATLEAGRASQSIVLRVLSRTGLARGVDRGPVRRVLEDATAPPADRAFAAEALALSGERTAIPAILGLLQPRGLARLPRHVGRGEELAFDPAVRALAWLRAAEALPLLEGVQSDQTLHARFRVLAGTAAAAIRGESKDLIAAWSALLREGAADERLFAAEFLRYTGPESHRALPALIVALQDEDPAVRRFCARTIATFGVRGRGALRALDRMAEGDPDQYTRQTAAAVAAGVRGK